MNRGRNCRNDCFLGQTSSTRVKDERSMRRGLSVNVRISSVRSTFAKWPRSLAIRAATRSPSLCALSDQGLMLAQDTLQCLERNALWPRGGQTSMD
ncbi:hypothetical protein PsorP6_001134 [Peronosclerospora sorghi]|uniref:Uncharacterized protein n=1 Tax=Peronosclerospora sorghi TaxID=230839 RepID=A0ACC0WV36_9STRA|nr:hypothetical protein PsorP6_001134 [Peronosclerospora sorghi]